MIRKILKHKALYLCGIILSVFSFFLIDMKNLLNGDMVFKSLIGILFDFILFFICLDKVFDKKRKN